MSYTEKADNKKNIPRVFEKKMVEQIKPTTIRPADSFTFYGVTKTKAGVPEISLAIKLIMADGSQRAIKNHEIISGAKFDGAGLIEMETPTLSVKINGKNLQDLYDYLLEDRVVWIKEPDSSMTQTKEGEAEIESIEIEENQ